MSMKPRWRVKVVSWMGVGTTRWYWTRRGVEKALKRERRAWGDTTGPNGVYIEARDEVGA